MLAKSNPLQQVSLVRENEPDEMDAEQTFPTDEEIAAAQAGKPIPVNPFVNFNNKSSNPTRQSTKSPNWLNAFRRA